MPSERADEHEPPPDWRLRTAEANIAQVRRELSETRDRMTERLDKLATRVTVLEVKVGLWSAFGALLGSIAGALVVGLVLYLLTPQP